MRTRVIVFAIVGGLAVLGISAVAAQTDSTNVRHYSLGSQSSFETGCFGPCLCPILLRPLGGIFELKFVAFDGLFNNYAVSDVRWVASQRGSKLAIQGSGTYRVGGEFAVQEELTLYLSIGGSPPQRFDSGFIAGGGEFPKIDIDISEHGRMACVDTVMHVQAIPDPPAAIGGESGAVSDGLERAVPNPFKRQTEIRLNLAHSGPVDVAIYDALGHVVRHLANGAWLPLGSRTLPWDGRRDDGVSCAAGVYFVRAWAEGHLSVRRIVKVE